MNDEKFLELYKELEINVRSIYNLDNSESISYFLSHNLDFIKYENEIRYMSDIRNLLSHNPKINGHYVVEVSDETISFIKKLIKEIQNRKRLKDIMVPIKDVYFAYPDSKVFEVVGNLANRMYSHVPIKDGSKLIGVFDETSLFRMIKDEIDLKPELSFKDIDQYLGLENGNEVYLHANFNEFVDDLKAGFNKLYREGKRIGLVFVEDDKKNLVGIISTIDILGK